MQNNSFINILIKTFVNDFSKIRCCGSCMGGCQDEKTCFICCGYSLQDIKELRNSNPEFKEVIDKALREYEEEEIRKYGYCL